MCPITDILPMEILDIIFYHSALDIEEKSSYHRNDLIDAIGIISLIMNTINGHIEKNMGRLHFLADNGGLIFNIYTAPYSAMIFQQSPFMLAVSDSYTLTFSE